ncbi:hypothetical protein DEIPH_ctg013orf0037 [Deinococcus phoenicis]|uniref:Uncharacterized protein n=1 Tax=Deinococcus phoenicis TaxID=1476583 RepID=A0A016QSF9_9DEIO|nr:hypothetical protein [Deinococcus phoenicis]EYB68931.1 hypothetical protein DEIPH_ctg013orf0037 [Deinococcus phoenicis]
MKYVLKTELNGEPILDGLFDGLGVILHGQVVTPAYPAQEEALKADPRFKVYREPGVTEEAKVGSKAETETKKPTPAAKEK